MRFMPFTSGATSGLAVVTGTTAIDLARVDPKLPKELDDVIAGGAAMLARIADALEGKTQGAVDVATLTPRFPLARPGNFFCLGLNYADHAKEGGHAVPDYPAFFIRVRESLIAAGEPIIRPKVSERLDYEAELTIVIGKGGRAIPESMALEHVFGYTLFNDGSIRDFQRKATQWTAGKNFDRTGPVGPIVVTADELPPGAVGLRIISRLNGQTMQDSNTRHMLVPVAKSIALISEFTTLKPGDMIATGTPEGVGHARKPPVWMKAGDSIEIEVEKIGILKSPIVDEA
jgi:acylpyruvate hydrolase